MSYSTLTHRAGGRAGVFTIPYESVEAVTRLNCFYYFGGFCRNSLRAFYLLHLVDFSVGFSFKFDFYSEFKCDQSRAGKIVKAKWRLRIEYVWTIKKYFIKPKYKK